MQAVSPLVEGELRSREYGDPALQCPSTDRLEPLFAHPIVVSDGTDRDPGVAQAVNVFLDEPRAPFRRGEIRSGRAAKAQDTRGMEMQVYTLPRRSERDVHEVARSTLHPWYGEVGIDLSPPTRTHTVSPGGEPDSPVTHPNRPPDRVTGEGLREAVVPRDRDRASRRHRHTVRSRSAAAPAASRTSITTLTQGGDGGHDAP